MSTGPSSLESSIREAGAVFGVDADPEQLDLLRDGDGKLPRDLFRKLRVARSGRKGRPPGARNKANDQLARVIVQKHGCPIDFMASIYAMPLDQMVEAMLIADSTVEREERLLELVDMTMTKVAGLTPVLVAQNPSMVNRLTNMLERVIDLAKGLKSRPGDLAMKALNTQLAAARAVGEYTNSKKPVEVSAHVALDAIIAMPAPQESRPVDQVLRNLVDGINGGTIDPARLADMQVIDGEFVEVGSASDDDE